MRERIVYILSDLVILLIYMLGFVRKTLTFHVRKKPRNWTILSAVTAKQSQTWTKEGGKTLVESVTVKKSGVHVSQPMVC